MRVRSAGARRLVALALMCAATYVAIAWAVEQMPSPGLPYYICGSGGTMRVPADTATANAIFVRTRPGEAAFIERGDKWTEYPCR